jgi:hypothetical protein
MENVWVFFYLLGQNVSLCGLNLVPKLISGLIVVIILNDNLDVKQLVYGPSNGFGASGRICSAKNGGEEVRNRCLVS